MRGKGEGAVYKRASDNMWVATIELPPRDGKRRRRVLTARTKVAVVAKLRTERDRLGSDGDLPTATQTLEQWLGYWMRAVAVLELRPTTAEAYRGVIRLHIIPEIGTVRLDRLTARHVRQVHDRILGRGLSAAYAIQAHRVLSTALKAAEREGHIARNPVAVVKPPRRTRPVLEVLNLEECVRVLSLATAALETTPYDPYPMRWATAMLTGARRGEVLGLEVDRVTDHLDLSWQLQRIPSTATPPADYEMRHLSGQLYLTRPKSSAGWRVIPLVDPLRTALTAHMARMEPNEYGLLFTNRGRPIDPRADTRAWGDVLTGLDIGKHVRLHDVRHSAVDLLYAAGVPEHIIMEIVGHSTRMMTRSYKSRGNLPQLTAAMESLSALLAGGAT